MIELLRHLPFKGQLVLFLQLQGGVMQADSTLFDNSFLLCLDIMAAILGAQFLCYSCCIPCANGDGKESA